jgi:hypothetical protein
MTAKAKTFFLLLAILMPAAMVKAQQSVTVRPGLTGGQQGRYAVTASVETVVTPQGANGLSSVVRKELTATLVLGATSVGEHGEGERVATIESIGFRSIVNGIEQSVNASELVGKKIEYITSPSGHLAKASYPPLAGRLGLAELLFSLGRWFPQSEVAVGQSWDASGQGPFYSDTLSEISKGAATVYKLVALTGDTAKIEGAVTLDEKGTSTLTTIGGLTDASVIAAGRGTARFDFDIKAGRITDGSTESRLEGRLLHLEPTAKGQKAQPREGSLIETSRFSIKLLN